MGSAFAGDRYGNKDGSFVGAQNVVGNDVSLFVWM